jgi:hypothetical protein
MAGTEDGTGFLRLLGRGVDVIELTANGASDEELAVLADVLDEVESEQTAEDLLSRLRAQGHCL